MRVCAYVIAVRHPDRSHKLEGNKHLITVKVLITAQVSITSGIQSVLFLPFSFVVRKPEDTLLRSS